ncbi:peptidase inhibitor family I36 protein [Catelliglobosispora koreensis]|uniref:peptidase inhibitor family I36 protein n=1 Tax=Catelliglobosispora koreensis TaxID=129052 RepID=UPI0003A9758F|nr:peptidase inhibitor family I36 protein [Catelliglobosispora koreensis]
MPPRTTTAVVATLLAVAMVLASANSAMAVKPTKDLQAKIDAHLARYPGGTQISDTEVAYAGGTFVITFAAPEVSVNGVADCPSGWFCFYEHTNFGYPRGKLSSCGWQDLAWWGWHDRTEAVHFNQSGGSVVFISHVGPPDHSYDYGLFSVSTGRRTISDVYPYRNMADHVYRYC